MDDTVLVGVIIINNGWHRTPVLLIERFHFPNLKTSICVFLSHSKTASSGCLLLLFLYTNRLPHFLPDRHNPDMPTVLSQLNFRYCIIILDIIILLLHMRHHNDYNTIEMHEFVPISNSRNHCLELLTAKNITRSSTVHTRQRGPQALLCVLGAYINLCCVENRATFLKRYIILCIRNLRSNLGVLFFAVSPTVLSEKCLRLSHHF